MIKVTNNLSSTNKNQKGKNMKIKLLTALLIMTTFVNAEVSKNLLGTWVLDKEATIKEMKSIKDKPLTDTNIQNAITHMSDVAQVLTQENLKLIMGGKERMSFKVVKETEKESLKVVTVSAKRKDKEINIDLTFIPKENGSFIIKSSATNDMNHYVWKKK